MGGKDYQRLSIEKDWNRQRNSATIQDEEITISRTSYKAQLITTTVQLVDAKIEGRRSRGRPRTTWITDLTNSIEAKYCQLKITAGYQNRWHGLVVNLAQETALQYGIALA